MVRGDKIIYLESNILPSPKSEIFRLIKNKRFGAVCAVFYFLKCQSNHCSIMASPKHSVKRASDNFFEDFFVGFNLQKHDEGLGKLVSIMTNKRTDSPESISLLTNYFLSV